MNPLNEWGRRMLALFFPYRCAECKQILPPEHYWCPQCLARHVQIVAHTLPPHDTLDGLVTLTPYDRKVRMLFHLAKYHHNKNAVAALRSLAVTAAERLRNQPFWRPEFNQAPLVFIPGDAKRLSERGIDIPRSLLSPAFSEHPSLDLLIRNRPTRPQYSLDKRERRLNVAHCFSLTATPAPWKIILLLDDILTTGATLREAARTIKTAEAVTVIGLALAHDNQFS